MTLEVFLTPNTFTSYLQLAHESEWTGRIDVSTSDNLEQKWSISLLTGQLIWCSGGAHWQRRWRRLLYQYCPHISVKETTPLELWADYYQLVRWVELG